MNKITRKILRIWISLSSMGVFLVGWVALAHAPKPAPLVTQEAVVSVDTPLPSLEPVPSLESLVGGSGQLNFSQPNIAVNLPRLRTRGS